MDALLAITIYLVQTLLGLYLLAMLLRFLLQLVRADFYNPVCQFLVKITNPLVIPVRKLVPGYGGLDLSSLLLSVLLHMVLICALVMLKYGALPPPGMLLLGGLLGTLALLVQIYFFALLAMIILSWVAPGSRNPAVFLLFQITEPVMVPFRRLLPSAGGMDFSPILVFILINVIQIALGYAATAAGVAGLAPWLR